VRAGGAGDDPAGGVLADAPDVWAWAQPAAHRLGRYGEVSEAELVTP
jgi:hypothetical protein